MSDEPDLLDEICELDRKVSDQAARIAELERRLAAARERIIDLEDACRELDLSLCWIRHELRTTNANERHKQWASGAVAMLEKAPDVVALKIPPVSDLAALAVKGEG